MEKTLTIIFYFAALIGFLNIGFYVGKISYRITLAIDELLYQRKQRKNK